MRSASKEPYRERHRQRDGERPCIWPSVASPEVAPTETEASSLLSPIPGANTKIVEFEGEGAREADVTTDVVLRIRSTGHTSNCPPRTHMEEKAETVVDEGTAQPKAPPPRRGSG